MNDKQIDSPLSLFLEDHPETETVEVVLTDLNGIYRGKWLPASAVVRAAEHGRRHPLGRGLTPVCAPK